MIKNRAKNKIYRKYLFLILPLVLLIIILIIAFERSPDHHPGEAYLLFDVDFHLLGDKYEDNDLFIRFHPPAEWLSLPDEMIQKVISADQDENEHSIIEIQLRRIFYNSLTRSICFLSVLTGPEGHSKEDIISLYIEKMENKFIDLRTQTGSFKHNKLNFNQIMIMDDDNIIIKLVSFNELAKAPAFVLEFAVPFEYYEHQLKAIESSIGSIELKYSPLVLP